MSDNVYNKLTKEQIAKIFYYCACGMLQKCGHPDVFYTSCAEFIDSVDAEMTIIDSYLFVTAISRLEKFVKKSISNNGLDSFLHSMEQNV